LEVNLSDEISVRFGKLGASLFPESIRAPFQPLNVIAVGNRIVDHPIDILVGINLNGDPLPLGLLVPF
jgi:hypothetical protein